jgi:hypothetical protein
MDLSMDFGLPADVITNAELLARVKELRLFPFPQSAAEIEAETREVKDLTIEERLNGLFELIRRSEEFLDRNPGVRAAYDRYKEDSEAAWQRAQRELFERCGV